MAIGPGRERVQRCRTELRAYLLPVHSLPGAHGRTVLEQTARQWNESGYAPSWRPVPRCWGDYLSPASRYRKMRTN